MAKSSPEKLAAALRANLKRRKAAQAAKAAKPGPKPARAARKPPKAPEKLSLALPFPGFPWAGPPATTAPLIG